MADHAIELRDISKRFSSHLAVDHLSLVVPRGAIYGVLGPNGAGKSTTIRIALNLIGHDSGSVRLLGADPAERKNVLSRVGYLPEERGLYRKMTALEVIVFCGRLKGMTKKDARSAGAYWLDRMGLAARAGARVDQLSKGMQQKLQFIATVVHDPELLILDEPGSGLDPLNQEFLHDILTELRGQGCTIVVSTHSMERAELLCDSVCIISKGRKVLDGRLRDIRLEGATNRWQIVFAEPLPEAPAALTELAVGGQIGRIERGFEIELGPAHDGRTLMTALSRLERAPDRVSRVVPTLHEIFLARVGENGGASSNRDVGQ